MGTEHQFMSESLPREMFTAYSIPSTVTTPIRGMLTPTPTSDILTPTVPDVEYRHSETGLYNWLYYNISWISQISKKSYQDTELPFEATKSSHWFDNILDP